MAVAVLPVNFLMMVNKGVTWQNAISLLNRALSVFEAVTQRLIFLVR